MNIRFHSHHSKSTVIHSQTTVYGNTCQTPTTTPSYRGVGVWRGVDGNVARLIDLPQTNHSHSFSKGNRNG